MASEDITFCSNRKCSRTKCERHPKRIKQIDIPHSFADLDNTGFCLKSDFSKGSDKEESNG